MSHPGMNYELIYKCRAAQDKVFTSQRRIAEAKANAERAETTFREYVAKMSGVPIDDLRFSDDGCLADGIARHVYHIKVKFAPHGHHENKCVFCGCDNVSDLY